MKNLLFYLLLLLMAMPAYAQKSGDTSYDKEKLEKAKVAFITKRLDLTPGQAEKFWPLYNQFSENKKKLMKEMDHQLKEGEKLSNQQASALIDRKFEIEQKILDMEKAFQKNITKVISPVQALKLDDVNKDFARHIYRMQKRKKGSSE